jgi:hypothetical protein
MRNIIALLLTVAALTLAGCSTSSQTAKATDQIVKWGNVELSAGTPRQLQLKDGSDCTLTATLVEDGNLLVDIKSFRESTAEDVAQGIPNGTLVETTRTLRVPSGVEIFTCINGQEVSFTPQLQTP